MDISVHAVVHSSPGGLDLIVLISLLIDSLQKAALHILPSTLLIFDLFACAFHFLSAVCVERRHTKPFVYLWFYSEPFFLSLSVLVHFRNLMPAITVRRILTPKKSR